MFAIFHFSGNLQSSDLLNKVNNGNDNTPMDSFRLRTPISTKQTQLSNLKIVRQQRTTGDYYVSRR